MSRRSKKLKRRQKWDKRRKNRWKLLLHHANECNGDRSHMKNWGWESNAKEDKWATYRCSECGLYYKIEGNGRMRVRGCGTFSLPLDIITILGAIGESA